MVTITIDDNAGTIDVDGVLYIGEEAPVKFVDASGSEKSNVRFNVFQDGNCTVCLAHNEVDAGTLDLRSADLRKQFHDGEIKTFPCTAISSVSEDKDVYAMGYVTLHWSPWVYEDGTTPATLRGPQGEQGIKGDKGDAGSNANITAMRDANGTWHSVTLDTNSLGELVVVVGDESVPYYAKVENEVLYL